MTSVPAFPRHARVVVIGGGVIGCSVAYHLGHLGVKEVVLLERARLTSGTTWHAAGLIVTFGSTAETATELRKHTLALDARLQAETGKSTRLRPVGFIRLTIDSYPRVEYARVAAGNASDDWSHQIRSNDLWLGCVTITGFNAGAYIPSHPQALRPALAAALEAVAGGLVATEIDILPFSRAVEAHQRMDARKVNGRIVLTP